MLFWSQGLLLFLRQGQNHHEKCCTFYQGQLFHFIDIFIWPKVQLFYVWDTLHAYSCLYFWIAVPWLTFLHQEFACLCWIEVSLAYLVQHSVTHSSLLHFQCQCLVKCLIAENISFFIHSCCFHGTVYYIFCEVVHLPLLLRKISVPFLTTFSICIFILQ